MNITKRQLVRLIKEEKRKLTEIGFGSMEPFAPDYDTRDTFDDFEPIQLSYTNPQTGEEVSRSLYSNGEADDAFELMFSIDPNIKYSVDDIREGKHNIKITKRQLRRIIKEEKQKLLKEQFGSMVETGSDLIEFAQAYSGLGNAVQEQFSALVNEWNNNGAHSPDWEEAVYEQNPNAIDIVEQRLTSVLKRLAQEGSDDAEQLLWVIEEAQKIYRQGDDEVEADARAAGDR
jgi:hypothetical protein